MCVYALVSNSTAPALGQALKASTEEEKKLLTSGMGVIPAGTTLKTEFSAVLNSETDKVRVRMVQISVGNMSLCVIVSCVVTLGHARATALVGLSLLTLWCPLSQEWCAGVTLPAPDALLPATDCVMCPPAWYQQMTTPPHSPPPTASLDALRTEWQW